MVGRSSSIAVTEKWIGNDKLSSAGLMFAVQIQWIFLQGTVRKKGTEKDSVEFDFTIRSTTTGQQGF